jgi:hypothetical protein
MDLDWNRFQKHEGQPASQRCRRRRRRRYAPATHAASDERSSASVVAGRSVSIVAAGEEEGEVGELRAAGEEEGDDDAAARSPLSTHRRWLAAAPPARARLLGDQTRSKMAAMIGGACVRVWPRCAMVTSSSTGTGTGTAEAGQPAVGRQIWAAAQAGGGAATHPARRRSGR